MCVFASICVSLRILAYDTDTSRQVCSRGQGRRVAYAQGRRVAYAQGRRVAYATLTYLDVVGV